MDFFIILFQNILFLREFLACNGCFGLFTKIKKGSGTSFWCTFSVWFFHKNVPYLKLYQWTKFQCQTFFPSQDIKPNVLLSSYRQLMMSWTLRFILDQALKQWLTGRKREEDGNTKIWISWEWKELFRWNKKHLSQFLKSYHLVINKYLLKNSRHKF